MAESAFILQVILATVLAVSFPIAMWRAWLRLFPGIGLRANYGVHGGWFGTTVTFEGNGSNDARSWSR